VNKYYILILLLILPGCITVNNFRLHPVTIYNDNNSNLFNLGKEEQQNTSDTPKVDIKPSVNKDITNNNIPDIICPKYILPDLPKTPPLPLAKINKLDPSNSDELSVIEKDHILELHEYISNLKKYIRKNYTTYLSKCYPVKK
jgi:hypothetical protein